MRKVDTIDRDKIIYEDKEHFIDKKGGYESKVTTIIEDDGVSYHYFKTKQEGLNYFKYLINPSAFIK